MKIGSLEIGPGGSLLKFEASELWGEFRLLIENEGWKTYLLGPLKCDYAEIGFSLVFELDCLKQVSFCCVADSDGECKKLNDELILVDLGVKEGEFSWGKVVSLKDPRSGPMVVINYKP